MNRFPIAFAQTVAFAAATGSISWQVLRLLIQRGAILSPVAIALVIGGAFAVGAMLFALVLAPARARMSRRDAGGHPYPPKLLLFNVAISTVWMLAWAMPAIQFVALGGADTFWAFVCFSMGGLSGALFYEPIGSSRTPV